MGVQGGSVLCQPGELLVGNDDLLTKMYTQIKVIKQGGKNNLRIQKNVLFDMG